MASTIRKKVKDVTYVYEQTATYDAEKKQTIRKQVEYLYSEKAGKDIQILYGGSVNLNNYKKILSNENINGALIGGACLDVDGFSVMGRETY